MPRSSALLSVFLGLLIGGLGITIWSWRQRLAAAETTLASLARSEAARRLDAPAGRRERPAKDDFASAPAAAAPVSASTDTSPGARPALNRTDIRPPPEAQRLLVLYRKTTIDFRYAGLFKGLHLPPAQLEQLKALLVQRLGTSTDVFMEARAKGLDSPANESQLQKVISDLRAEVDESIHNLLGEAGFQQYRQYEQTLPQRALVSQIQQRLSYSPTPLYGNQAEQLVAVLAEKSPAGVSADLPLEGPRSTLNDAVITQSQAFLSSAQVEALRQYYRERMEIDRLNHEVQQNLPDSDPPPPPPPSGGRG